MREFDFRRVTPPIFHPIKEQLKYRVCNHPFFESQNLDFLGTKYSKNCIKATGASRGLWAILLPGFAHKRSLILINWLRNLMGIWEASLVFGIIFSPSPKNATDNRLWLGSLGNFKIKFWGSILQNFWV